eukprot:4031575-Ditylum_brightwellii.AAC.1
MRTETGKLFKSIQQCESFSVATLVKILTKLNETTKQNETAEEEQMTRKTIVTLSTKHILATAVRRRDMRVTEKCGDTEKCTALFADKIRVWNT